jgi:ABC-type transport system substrate-binding protein
MKSKIIVIGLSFLIVVSLLLASCGSSTTTTTSTTVLPTSTTTSVIATTSTTSVIPTTSTTSATTVTATTSSTGNWWDNLGKPIYGGTMTMCLNGTVTTWDPYLTGATNIECTYAERTGMDDWSLNPLTFAYGITWRPPQYVVPCLMSSWEFTSSNTFVLHMRQNVYWQNIAPANGALMTTADLVYDYSRDYGLGAFANPVNAASSIGAILTSLTSTSSTLVFQFNITNPETILETMLVTAVNNLEINPAAVQQWGSITQWNHAIGTGPFMMSDFVDSSAARLVRNPNYWGYDERHPANKLPYVDNLVYLIIPNQATALAAMRVGKIDAMDGISPTNAQAMAQTNPSILQSMTPNNSNCSIDPRNDLAPFNNLNVRIAMQQAINFPLIVSTYDSNDAYPYPLGLTSFEETGWDWTYDKWPASLQAEYTYNPTNAKALLAAAGYPNGFNTSVTVASNADLVLLQLIQSQLAAVNINMAINVMDATAWTQYVQVNHLDPQMAMRSGGSLNLSYEPITQLKRFQYGYTTDYAQVNDTTFNGLYAAFNACTAVSDMQAILLKANQLVAYGHWVINLPALNNFCFSEPWLKGGFNGQAGAVSSTGAGPTSAGTYLSRFWIDPAVKAANSH